MPKPYDKLLKLGFEEAGSFSRRGKILTLALSKSRLEKGCYAFVVGDNIRYIGVTKDSLSSRMNGYKNPGPTQQTNKRINPKIKKSGRVKIFFLPASLIKQFTITIHRGGFTQEVAPDPSMFERVLISFMRPPWNKD